MKVKRDLQLFERCLGNEAEGALAEKSAVFHGAEKERMNVFPDVQIPIPFPILSLMIDA